jgi:eukaryotic-like serine/threonine-protein kinase
MSDKTEFERKGDYEILGVLGAGGMGKVYKVRNVFSDRIEAMKVLLTDLAHQEELAIRFQREIKVLAALNHPNIAMLRTALMIDNQLVMIMEYVEGITLAAHLKKGKILWRDALHYIDQVLDALGDAHKHNVIHRDVKPGNMMLTPGGVVKLMDFGIARSGDELGLTVVGTTLGSLPYMSPEQIKCGHIDARADLYSVGVSLYEMVTGQKPFTGDNKFSIMQAQLQQTPRPAIEVTADLPESLNQIILMAMAKEPARRFQSAGAFREALKNVQKKDTQVTATDLDSPEAKVSTRKETAPPAAALLPRPDSLDVGALGAQTRAAQTSRWGHRGLYITLGAVIVFVVAVAAAFTVPNWFKTRANGGGVSQTDRYAPAQPASGGSRTRPLVPGSPTSSAGATDVDSTSAPLSPPPDKMPAPNAASVRRSAAKPADIKNQPSEPSGDYQADSRLSTQPPRSDPAELAELDHEMDQITAREAVANAGLDSLQRAQSGQGLQLRGDIFAAQQRMQAYAAKARSSLQAQDIENTKKYLNLMETELGTIEKFLGN